MGRRAAERRVFSHEVPPANFKVRVRARGMTGRGSMLWAWSVARRPARPPRRSDGDLQVGDEISAIASAVERPHRRMFLSGSEVAPRAGVPPIR
ncbi:hypothetical protein SGLAM104S_08083 [Streptomyces glaucescens]